MTQKAKKPGIGDSFRILNSLNKVISQVMPDDLWPGAKTLPQTCERVETLFKADSKIVDQDLFPILSGDNDIDLQTELTENTLKRWQSESPPSLCAISNFVINAYFPDCTPEYRTGLMMAGVLGEVEHTPSYHSNMHFRKVLLAVSRLIIEHNEIYHDTSKVLDARDAALLMIAACIHDLGHDGMGNTIYGVFYEGRLEERSFDLAKPYLFLCGLDEEDLGELQLMIRTTEVTPLREPTNPMNQMKAAYKFHFSSEGNALSALHLEDKFKTLETNRHLTTKALLLHEADIATSAGLTYNVTKYETCLYMDEISDSGARPSHVTSFLNQICNRQFLTDAGQRLHGANLSRIYTLAERDKEGGDKIFSKPDQSNFQHSKDLVRHHAPKSIN